MQKPLGIQKCDGRTDLPTYRPTDTARCRVACPRLKKVIKKWMKICKILLGAFLIDTLYCTCMGINLFLLLVYLIILSHLAPSRMLYDKYFFEFSNVDSSSIYLINID